MSENTVGVRVQRMTAQDKVLILSQLAVARSNKPGNFAARDITNLFVDLSLPAPGNLYDVLKILKRKEYITTGNSKGNWKLTPLGRQRCRSLLSEMDLVALAAEAASSPGPVLGSAIHSVIPPTLAPPSLLSGLRRFLDLHPFETNVFGMTRFPDEGDEVRGPDPVGPALEIAREVCQLHGLEFHLASDRAIDDDLWTNVAAHMWASHYGIAFFEDRRKRGMNYNLAIEVGGMLTSGRRCALLKDKSIDRMPTDLVGRIYKSVDLDDEDSIRSALHAWIREDIALGPCSRCS
ncbi:MAG TPA: hypothetical protein VF525_09100 [Pyrinomonadaceae bacterium]|jgi:DNA-binding PadR family transcriptional regulator